VERLQFFARLEANRFARGNGDFRARARVPADSRLPRFHVEYAESTKFDAITLLKSALHTFEHRFHGHFGLRLGNSGFVHNFVYDIQLDQRVPPSAAAVRKGDLKIQTHDKIRVKALSSETQTTQSQTPSVDASTFRRLCSRFATGITVLTVCDRDGSRHGMTANSFTSVSLDPPLVLVCIDLKTRILDYLTEGTACAINILTENQQDVSARFASPIDDRFEGVCCRPGAMQAPVLDDSLAVLECVVERLLEAGDHVIVLGRVIGGTVGEGHPLLYFGSAYRKLLPG
jgi:flavin reductase (DIM6/NTAB) family NADH-FMN oxidoreductase RutF